MDIFLFSKWRPAAIFDFVTCQKWRYGALRTVHSYHRAKYGDNSSNGGRFIAIFRFSKWRSPPSWILLEFIFRPPTKSNWWPEATVKILYRSDLYFRTYCDFNFQKFGLKYLFGPKNWGFWGISPLNISGYHRDHKRHFLARNRAFWCIDRQNWSTVATCRRGEETKKRSHKQWYFTHAPRPPT